MKFTVSTLNKEAAKLKKSAELHDKKALGSTSDMVSFHFFDAACSAATARPGAPPR